mgnify:CR=1 FL=1
MDVSPSGIDFVGRRLTQEELASVLEVSKAAVSQATSRGHKCGGHPVYEWAVFHCGEVVYYEVPLAPCCMLGLLEVDLDDFLANL